MKKCIFNGYRYSVCEKGIVYSGPKYKKLKLQKAKNGYIRDGKTWKHV